MLKREEMIEKFSDIIKVDIDAAHAYDQAIKHIDLPALRDQLIRFKADHERHINSWVGELRALNAEEPSYSPDFKGFMLEGFTALRSLTGIEGALKALRSGEEMTNKRYEQAYSWEVSAGVRIELQKFVEDEKRHLRFIEQALNAKVWEAAA